MKDKKEILYNLFSSSKELDTFLENKSSSLILGADNTFKQIFSRHVLKYGSVFFVFENYKALKEYALSLDDRSKVYTYLPLEFDSVYSEADDMMDLRERLSVISRLKAGSSITILTTRRALCERLSSEIISSELSFKTGQSSTPEDLCQSLVDRGYIPSEIAEAPGQFSKRGAIVDFCDFVSSFCYRVVFDYDEIEEIKTYDPATQRMNGRVKSVSLYPTGEVWLGEEKKKNALEILSKRQEEKIHATKDESQHKRIEQSVQAIKESMNENDFSKSLIYHNLFLGECSILDFAKEKTLFFVGSKGIKKDINSLKSQFSNELEVLFNKGYSFLYEDKFYFSFEEISRKVRSSAFFVLEDFQIGAIDFQVKEEVKIDFVPINTFSKGINMFASSIATWVSEGMKIVVTYRDEKEKKTVIALLNTYEIKYCLYLEEKSGVYLVEDSIKTGTYSRRDGVVILPVSYILGEEKKPKKIRHSLKEEFLSFVKNDFVVCEDYGVGRFVGMEKVAFGKSNAEMAKIIFAGGDELLLSCAKLDKVHKYASAEAENVKLSVLRSKQWNKTMSRARESAKKLADEYLTMYYDRINSRGYSFSADTDYQRQFELSFPYEETLDQLDAINDVKKDMEKDVPMDRLVCGDVGFGKTEVAIRAMFKCVENSKQVAFLVPTTVLAYMHYTNFVSRFSDYGISVEMLSSFRSSKHQKKVARDFSNGLIDIVVGTHRLLSEDVKPKDLGLLVVDEEQRFGVMHKDKMKLLSKDVDTLTLSATPIPRTLNMALTGIRDVSNITQPPKGRSEVVTYVMEMDNGVVKNAILRELKRNGQVYYLYNKVEKMEKKKEELLSIIPSLKIGIAHGQMTKATLEKIMVDFLAGEYEVLLCSTIIENGIDIPSVNTIIIEDAQNLGLSQLHQLRGRVGRSTTMGYAYMLFGANKELTDIQIKRLKTIKEFAKFGSGVKIARIDLQLRGAGELLGANQSGHFANVGYDLYMKLLREATQGKLTPGAQETANAPNLANVDLDIPAYIPDTFIPGENERIVLYKKIALIDAESDKNDLKAEMEDRYGQIPICVKQLLDIAALRISLAKAGISRVSQKGSYLEFIISREDFAPSRETLDSLYRCHSYKFITHITPPKFVMELKPTEDPLEVSEKVADILVKKDN